MAVSAIHHIDLAVRDIERSRAFYNHALEPLGLLLVMPRRNPEGHDVLGYGQHPDPVFWIRNGKPPVGKLHVAFLARTHEAVDAFHAAALVAGGTCNGPPGLRPRYGENYYAAFVIDPDGNNIEAVCRAPDGVDR
jgi:catechol 2,3-dioxygenase-like lactoylglutathione lyase family enzyme